MPSFCAVVNCSSRGDRDNVNFYGIPSVLKFKFKPASNELSVRRREKWLAALRRGDLNEEKLKYAKVCSKHFLTGKPSKLEDFNNPDWVPSVNMGYGFKTEERLNQEWSNKESRAARQQRREFVEETTVNSTENVKNKTTTELEGITPTPEHLSCCLHVCQSSQTDMDMTDLSMLLTELSITETIKEKTISCQSLKDNDKKTRYYTGLPTYQVFLLILNLIKPFITIHGKTCLPAADQILLTLIKLRLNLDFTDLGYRFVIHTSTASSYFKNVINIMFARLNSLCVWPDREILLKTMPRCFTKSFHGNTTVIIDCFEIRCKKPAGLLSAAQVWSNYKHSNTIKYLIAITPQGTVAFISEGWGGRVSDKILTQNSNFLDHLCPGDVVMADRGFLIKEFVELFQASVKIPAFTKGKSQLHPVDLEKTRSVAHVRIHVERIIGQLRSKYKICNGTLPITLLATKGDKALLDEIIVVCCALINLCPPVVPL